jgi:hypothetical protein
VISKVENAIAAAEALLPGQPGPEGEMDDRWQAIIRVSEFIETEPEAVWQFVARWGGSPDHDLRMAIATCIVEPLLEHHGSRFSARIEDAARANPLFREMVSFCWTFEAPADSSGTVRETPTLSDSAPRFTAHRYQSNAEADTHDREFWLGIPAEERVLMVWRLSVEQWRLRGDSPYEPGLHRSTARLYRR